MQYSGNLHAKSLRAITFDDIFDANLTDLNTVV